MLPQVSLPLLRYLGVLINLPTFCSLFMRALSPLTISKARLSVPDACLFLLLQYTTPVSPGSCVADCKSVLCSQNLFWDLAATGAGAGLPFLEAFFQDRNDVTIPGSAAGLLTTLVEKIFFFPLTSCLSPCSVPVDMDLQDSSP
jgi:hypothetical protein